MPWRERSNETLSSRFVAVCVRPASRDWKRSTPHPLEWLLVEWPEGESEPTKYWLSTLPEDASIDVLVDRVKLRWRIERDYEELKSELGLAHFGGRGFRHHATLCIAAHGFLIRERTATPPQAPGGAKRLAYPLAQNPEAPPDPRRASHRKLDRDNPTAAGSRAGPHSHALSLLPNNCTSATPSKIIVTQ